MSQAEATPTMSRSSEQQAGCCICTGNPERHVLAALRKRPKWPAASLAQGCTSTKCNGRLSYLEYCRLWFLKARIEPAIAARTRGNGVLGYSYRRFDGLARSIPARKRGRRRTRRKASELGYAYRSRGRKHWAAREGRKQAGRIWGSTYRQKSTSWHIQSLLVMALIERNKKKSSWLWWWASWYHPCSCYLDSCTTTPLSNAIIKHLRDMNRLESARKKSKISGLEPYW